MFKEIWEKLEIILNWIVASTTLNIVYNYDIKTAESFPYATISVMDGEEIYLDNLVNLTNLKYIIRVYDQNKSIALMEARMRLLIDNIMIELRKKGNCTLWDIAESMTFNLNWWWQDMEMPVRVCEITCNIQMVNNI